MNRDQQKVTAHHLARKAYLYVRQSTPRQVVENKESTQRQYALRERAHALGWPIEQVIVIDSDLGQSSAERDRAGFTTLVGEVTLGNVGIVLAIEVSRLARRFSEWHQLIELCALTDTLILDEDGIYDPNLFNDRLVIGLKAQASEVELHYLKSRMQGGLRNAARRGDLKLPLPVGLAYDPLDRVVLEPDAQIRNSLSLLFATFARTGSALATVREFRARGLLVPRRVRSGVNKGTVLWVELTHSRTLQILHNPRYAGAFVFGRMRTRRQPDGRVACTRVPLDEVEVLLRDQHEGYISWERFEANQQRLTDNAASGGGKRRPPREGPALLQGLAICGRCGQPMTVRYHSRKATLVPDYLCQAHGIEHGVRRCQHVPGGRIDRAIGALLVELMTPAALEVVLQVQKAVETRVEEIDAWHDQRVQRAREEADLARQRFMNTRPDHRIVADVLEGEWNEKLRCLDEVQRECDKRRAEDRRVLEDEQRQRILDLASNFPRLWNDPATPDRERKRMVHLLIEDVTITSGERITLDIRLRGGAIHQLDLPPTRMPYELYVTPPEVIEAIDRLLDEHCEGEIAVLLNQRGLRTGYDKPFTLARVQRVQRSHNLRHRYQRLRDRGLLTGDELAERLGVCAGTIKRWRRRGLLVAEPYDKRRFLYPIPDNPPVKFAHKSRNGVPSMPDPAGPNHNTAVNLRSAQS